MKSKLRLDLDQLQVESFDTAAHPGAAGTVHGHYRSVYTIDCSGCNTGSEPATGDSKCTECFDCTDTSYQTCGGDTCNDDTCNSCDDCQPSWRWTDCQASCVC